MSSSISTRFKVSFHICLKVSCVEAGKVVDAGVFAIHLERQRSVDWIVKVVDRIVKVVDTMGEEVGFAAIKNWCFTGRIKESGLYH